jgi:integrase
MCDRLGAALLYFKDEYPPVNDWVFGSLRTGRPLHRTSLDADHLLPALRRMAVAFQKEIPYGIPRGTGFHALRHAYNVLIDLVGTDDPKKVKEVQMKLLRHGDERTNDRMESRLRRYVSARVRHISMRAIWRWESRLLSLVEKWTKLRARPAVKLLSGLERETGIEPATFSLGS